MLPRNHPDRIRIVFDDHRLVANAGLLLPATLTQHLGLRELVDHRLDLGGAGAGQHRRQADDPGRLSHGRRRLHRRRRCVAHRGDGLHPGHLPVQLPVGPRPPAGPGEPGAAGPLGPDPATRRSPSTSIPPSARPTDWPRRAPATTAIPASGATTRCWPSPPARSHPGPPRRPSAPCQPAGSCPASSRTSGVHTLILSTTLQPLGSMSSMLVMTTWPSTSGSILPWR